MSNSPPSKVSLLDTNTARVLCSGIDTLVLTVDILWKSEDLFNQLARAKAEASFLNDEVTIELKSCDDTTSMFFNIRPFGSRGYEWILTNREYTIQIGNWTEPGSRPSVLIEIRSETLHKHGEIRSIEIILGALVYAKAEIKIIRVTRADLYCDVLLPNTCWTESMKEYLVTRATKRSFHDQGKVFSGFSIGKGDISARLYDKPLEIKQKSGKKWMYNIWGLEKVPAEHNVIRVEFQLRRGKLKLLGINTFHDLLELDSNLWAYCTNSWLKLQDKSGTHHTQRHTFKWWETVQAAYKKAQDATPLVSKKAANQDKEQLVRQLIGNITSLIAVESKGKMPEDLTVQAWHYWITRVFSEAEKFGASQEDLKNKIRNKMAKYSQSSQAYSKALKENDIHNFALSDYFKGQLKIERKEFNSKKIWEQKGA